MSQLTEQALHDRWRDRWEGFLGLVESSDDSEEVQNVLRDKVTIGNAERKIAGGHEGREILELLQNARDAIWKGDSTQGRVHVGVYDEGVLVANTGSRFDLYDREVEDAVTMIGETGKGDDGDQSIGHKGVGLKSILATGDAFEIFTRPEQTADDILGVRLSRTYLVTSLLNRLGQDVDTSSLINDIDDPKLAGLIGDESHNETIALTDEVAESISKLPLFSFPVPLAVDETSSDAVRNRVRELLTESPAKADGEPYRTAVFIRYEDTNWRSQLSDIGIPVPGEENEDERPLEERPQRIWEYLSHEENDSGLQPETLVQLGGIEELHLERATGAKGQTVNEERWRIVQNSTPDTILSELSHEEVHVRVRTPDSSEIVHRFDQFQFKDPRQHHTSLLVNKAKNDAPPSFKSYPLYLFYPIESTNEANLPFCLHGRFQVETNRKDLSSNNFETNRRVLEEGIDLVELVGQEIATATDAANAPLYSSRLPWVLLPPVPEDEVSEPTSNDELIDWFHCELFDRLAETPCISTSDGPRSPDETLLHWNDTVIEGYVAYRVLLEELNRQPISGSTPLPAQPALETVLTMPSSWTDRVKALLQINSERETSREILSGWIEHLESSLSMQEGEDPAIAVSASPARSLLEGTVALLTASTEKDGSLTDILDELSERFDGVYHLPCQIKNVDPSEKLALVTLERRRTPTGEDVTQRRIRSVIWDIKSSTQEVQRPPTPPKSSNMTVYFLDERVQEISDIHHVLSVAGRMWGLRAYEGIPSFVRSLLDTFADGRHETVEPIDFAFLAAIVDRLGAESSDLQTGEGEFFPLEYLRTAVTQQEGDQRANLRRRVQLRTCDLRLHEDITRPLSDTVLTDGWQTARERGLQSTDEDDPTEDWDVIESSPAPTWPEPNSSTWKTYRKQINREVTDFDFARTLALLGTATLPGIRILWMYGDDHPSMRQPPHWDPTEWTTDDFVGPIPDSVQGLRSVLSDAPDYLPLITSHEYHPQTSGDHSSKCPVKIDSELKGTNLASWIWFDDVDQLEEHGNSVRELLRRHGDALGATLLRTGWSCNRGHKRRAWTESIPSLLNWQLRELDIWDPVVAVADELENEWGEQTSRLRYAVRIESRRGAQAARMFPYLEGDSGFSDRLLDTFGVTPVDELGVTGATERFQKLQSVLVNGSLPMEGTARLWIPGERVNDWNQAYTQLLQPVLKQLPENPEADDDQLDWGALTHLPLRDGDDWVTASVEWITSNTDQIRYYKDQSPKPWETQAVEDEGYYILPRTAGGPFRRLTSALGIDQVEASKLVFEPEADGLNVITDRYSEKVGSFQRTLAERRDLLVASTERSDEEEIISAASDLSVAATNLAVAESFPEDALRQLSDPASALYATEEGDEALMLNASEAGDPLSLNGLAMGLSLLVESPTKVATFREALREDIEVAELESRWTKRTFPIETVKRVLGSNALQSIEQDVLALNDLLDRIRKPTPDPDPALAALEDADSDTFTAVREWLATGESPTANGQDANTDLDPAVENLVTELRASLPKELTFVVSGLFSETVTHWVRELEAHDVDTETAAVVIEWLNKHRTALERPPFDKKARQAYSRFQTVTELWAQTDVEELTEIETWTDRLYELHSSTSPAWTTPLPDEYADALDCPPFVVYVCINNRVVALVEEFCDDIETELTEVEFDWRALVVSYVENGKIPEPETTTGAKDHQQQAFADLATALGSDDKVIGFTDEFQSIPVGSDTTSPSISVSSGGGNSGGSTQYRGRGQQGEAYVMAGVLDRIASWLEEHPASDFFQFRSRFRRLCSEQQDADYKWHVKSVWSSDLLPLLGNSKELDASVASSWRLRVADGESFTEHPLIRLINVTMERGPGFDVIDPLGPVSQDQERDDFGLCFTPIEVKAVDGSTPPFSFRLTTNEYRQAKAFVRSDVPYVIRLVSVPNVGTANWPEQTEIAAEKVIETETELKEVVGNKQFEEVVKGGYMNMKIE
jgi:hypothetical protein